MYIIQLYDTLYHIFMSCMSSVSSGGEAFEIIAQSIQTRSRNDKKLSWNDGGAETRASGTPFGSIFDKKALRKSLRKKRALFEI